MTHSPPPPDLLLDAIGRLPRRLRTILVLSICDGLSAEQIARREGHSVDRVRRRLASALRRLDRLLMPPKRPSWRFR